MKLKTSSYAGSPRLYSLTAVLFCCYADVFPVDNSMTVMRQLQMSGYNFRQQVSVHLRFKNEFFIHTKLFLLLHFAQLSVSMLARLSLVRIK